MGLFKKNDEPYSLDDFLKETMLVSLFLPNPLLFAAGGAYAVKKTVEGTLSLNKRRRAIAKKRRAIRQEKKEERRIKRRKPPRVKTNRQKALEVKKAYQSRLQIIDEMAMDDESKQEVKHELYLEYLWHLKKIIG